MTVEEIIKQVRWCIDEESGTTDYVDASMDNIIKAKIGDAMRWICLYGDASLLTGSDEASAANSLIQTCTIDVSGAERTESEHVTYEDGVITLPYDFMKVIRVRAKSWRRGVSRVISEDSDTYLMQTDPTAMADAMNPVVALIDDVPNQLELYPKPVPGDEIYLTYVKSPSNLSNVEADKSSANPTNGVEGEETVVDTTGTVADVAVPMKAKSAFIYYIAYLVMCAYNDVTKANTMLGVAKAQIGGAQTLTDAG